MTLRLTVILAAIFMLGGCAKQNDISGYSPITGVAHYLNVAKTNGDKSGAFRQSDTIVVTSTLHNVSGATVFLQRSQGCPFVRFFIRQRGVLIADSFYGMYFTQDAPTMTFHPDERIEVGWMLPAASLRTGTLQLIAEPAAVTNSGRIEPRTSSLTILR